ncbi:hypothetical protein Peur_026132 [Populus x canadensis]
MISMNDVNSSGVALLLIIPDHVGRIVLLPTLRLREDIVKLCVDPKLKGEYPPQVFLGTWTRPIHAQQEDCFELNQLLSAFFPPSVDGMRVV